MKEKIRRLGADLRFAYTFPFSRSGFIPFLILCGCTLVPFLGLFVTGIAFCLQTGRPQDRRLGRFIGTPIKMGIAAAVYAAPILVLQLLIRFAEPLNAWLGLALLLLLIWFALRFLLLYPWPCAPLPTGCLCAPPWTAGK